MLMYVKSSCMERYVKKIAVNSKHLRVYTFIKVFMFLHLVSRLQNLVDISKLDRLSTIKLTDVCV